MNNQDEWSWVGNEEARKKEERSKDYFNIVEGKQQFVLLSHFARYAEAFEGGKYRPAVEGDTNISMRGVCWVLQDGVIKSAKMPYTIVKIVRELRDNPEWEFELPFPHVCQLSAVGAGTKEVKYSLTPSPRVYEIPADIIKELEKKPAPEEIVEKMRGNTVQLKAEESDGFEYPTDEINPEDIPFD